MKKFLDQIAVYLFIKKKENVEGETRFTKYMHGMNRISIFLFLIALLVILFKSLILPLLRK